MNTPSSPASASFSGYQKVVVGMLAFLQFAVILDFMLMAPLGAVIMPALSCHARAVRHGRVGVRVRRRHLGPADRGIRRPFRPKEATALLLYRLHRSARCGAVSRKASNRCSLARIVTGLFGGVIGSVVLAIATDLFPPQMRGRVMGFIQTAFAASQILGIPIGIYLSNQWNWHVPFLALVVLGVIGGLLIAVVHETGRGPPEGAAGTQRLQPSAQHGDRAALPDVVRIGAVPGDRRLHADAVQQRLHGEQPRDLAPRPAHHLSGDRNRDDLRGPARRQGRRHVRQAARVLHRNRADHRHGADLHAPGRLDAGSS